MRPVSPYLALLLAGLLLSPAFALEPRLEWSYETQGKIYASPVLADLEADGATEILVAASRDQRLLCLDGRGKLRWEYRIEDGDSDGLQATPSAVDFDGDGQKEVFWLSKGGTFGCLDAQGRLIWRILLGDHFDYTAPVLADINADQHIEFIFGSDSGTLYCLDDAGQILWRFQGEGRVCGTPAVAAIGSESALRIFAVFGAGLETCFDSDGNIVWKYTEDSPVDKRWSNVAAGDLDGDGALEVVSATEDFHVIARDAATGGERWRFKGKGIIDQTCGFALASFDSGTSRPVGLDVLAGDSSGNVYRLSAGQPVWTADVGGGVVQGPAVGDVNGDGALEVLVCARSNRLVCLSADGREQWSFKTEAAPLTTPALGDVDGDGEVEIVYTSKDRFVRCLSVGGAHNPALLPWPMTAHDAQNSNNVKGAAFAPKPAEKPAAPLAALEVPELNSLRMGANVLTFHFANDSTRPRRLETTAELSVPGAAPATQTVSLICRPYEQKDVRLPVAVRAAGACTLNVRLIDVGTGRTLQTVERTADVLPFQIEREEADALRSSAGKDVTELQDDALRMRARTAVDEASALFDKEMAAAQSGDIDPAIIAVHAALDTLRRTVARLHAAHASPVAPAAFAAVPDTTLTKVFMDEPYPSEARPALPLRVDMARNEYEGAQLVIVPLWQELTQLRVLPGELRLQGGAGVIPKENVRIHRVDYVEIGPPEYYWPVAKVGKYPDVLWPAEPVNVPASQDAQPYFIVLKTDEGTPAGDYAGTIRVEAEGAAPMDVPISAHVWSFALPTATTLKTSFWMNESFISSFYGYEGRPPFDVRKRFYDLHLEHRMSPVKDFSREKLEDFEYLMSHGQNCFFVPIPDKMEPAKLDAFKQKLYEDRDLIRAKGWEDKVLFYSHDEVAVMARHLIPEVREMNTWIKEILPEWPRLETSAAEQALLGAVDIWCPTMDDIDPVMIKSRKAAGERLWLYTVWERPGIMIDAPATDHRLLFWECWKYGAEGYLYWGTTHWSYNCQGEGRWPNRPWTTFNRQPGHNGCGYLIYPGPDGTPLPSVRMNIARDGIEDYEYFHLLRTLLDQRPDAPAEVRREAESVLEVDPAVVTDNEVFTEDPGVLLEARARMARLIEALQAR